jgi:hypothetical protein
MKKASIWILGGVALGVIWLSFIGLERGTPDLMALATVLTAGAVLISSIAGKEK